jgi:Flp pilus assembly protein TadG
MDINRQFLLTGGVISRDRLHSRKFTAIKACLVTVQYVARYDLRESPVRKSVLSRISRFRTRFARAQRGATTVEFALVSFPLVLMTFGLLELAMVFLVATTLESAMERASRQIRTGVFQTSGATTAADFKGLVCSDMSWLSSKCATDLWLDVRTYPNYSAAGSASTQTPSTFDPVLNPPCFSPGHPTDIVLVRGFFQWRLFTPLLSVAFENMGGGSGKRLITATTAFRNEPYDTTPPQGGSACAALT